MSKLNFALLRTLCLAIVTVVSLVTTGCPGGGGKDPNVKPNPAFEMAPPMAKDFFVRKLEKPIDGAELALEAVFEKGIIADKFLAINVNDTTVVLRDDGQKGDAQAEDGVFTIAVKDTENELRDEILKQQSFLADQKNIFSVVNRSAKFFDKKDQIGIQDIDLKERFRLPGFTVFVPGTATPHPNLKTHSLMITNLGVVEDPTRTFNPCTGTGNPNGAWTFGNLMRELASPNPGSIATDAQVSQFVLDFLNEWNSPQTVNSESLPARISIQTKIIDPWLARSSAAGAPSGQLLMQFAPFKLLAIVNRLDLRGNSGYGFSNAGEGRFVFCALDRGCSELQFTVIFEYGINKHNCSSVKAFAQQWENLASSGMAIGSPAYNTALQAITDQFSKSGTNTSQPNQSSLNQLRTNEIDLDSPWELREFKLDGSPVRLQRETVKQEPAVKYNAKVANPNVVAFANWVNMNTGTIVAGNHIIPDVFPSTTTAFLGGKSHTIFPPTGLPTTAHHWNGTPSLRSPAFIANDDARHIVSLKTCSGCHGGETQTFFTHVKPARFGFPAGLSQFLTGDTGSSDGRFHVIDAAARPFGTPADRSFNDLDDRAKDLSALASGTCKRARFPPPILEIARQIQFRPRRFTH